MQTLGGGAVIDHQPKGRQKRFGANVIKSLEALAQGSPADILLEAALALQIAPISEIISKSRLEPAIAEAALKELTGNGQIVLLDDTLATTSAHWKALQASVLTDRFLSPSISAPERYSTGGTEKQIETHPKGFQCRSRIPRY